MKHGRSETLACYVISGSILSRKVTKVSTIDRFNIIVY